MGGKCVEGRVNSREGDVREGSSGRRGDGRE